MSILGFLAAGTFAPTRTRLLRKRTWRPRAIDLYLFRHAALRFLAIVAVVIVIMTLENAPRLTADLAHADAPGALLWRLSLVLMPEHLSIAIPVAIFAATALAVRALAQRGEWQMLSAAGMSPTRAMAAPMLLATLAAAALLVNALALRPWGERQLDTLYAELAGGEHGVAIPLREPVRLDTLTLLLADGAGAAPGELTGVFVRRGDTIMAARTARVAADPRGGVALLLGAGTSVTTAPDGTVHRIGFAGLALHGRPPMLDLVPGNLRHRLDRLGATSLWQLAKSEETPPLRHAALAALLGRVDAALFCLMLPWVGIAVGVPPRRRAGGPAMMVGILAIVLHLQTSALVEDGLAAQATAATFGHALGWTAITWALVAWVRRKGDGAIDLAIERGLKGGRDWIVAGGPLPAVRRVVSAAATPPRGRPALRPAIRHSR